MAQSKQFQETLNLGKTLVDQFSDTGRTDLTTSWMAHYLAELITSADNETNLIKKRELQKEASGIILEIWKKRKNYPGSIAPLSNLTHVVSVIASLKDEVSDDLSWQYFTTMENDSPWGKYMRSTRINMETILRITAFATVAKEILDRENKWLEHESFLTVEEAKIIKFLDDLLKEKLPAFGIRIIYEEKGKPEIELPDKMTQVINKLRELVQDQSKYIDELEKVIIPKKIKKFRNPVKRVTKK